VTSHHFNLSIRYVYLHNTSQIWLDLGRRLDRVPARLSARPACTRAPRKPCPVAIATILLLYIDARTHGDLEYLVIDDFQMVSDLDSDFM